MDSCAKRFKDVSSDIETKLQNYKEAADAEILKLTSDVERVSNDLEEQKKQNVHLLKTINAYGKTNANLIQAVTGLEGRVKVLECDL